MFTDDSAVIVHMLVTFRVWWTGSPVLPPDLA